MNRHRVRSDAGDSECVAEVWRVAAVAAGRALSSDHVYVASYAHCDALLGELDGGLKVLSDA